MRTVTTVGTYGDGGPHGTEPSLPDDPKEERKYVRDSLSLLFGHAAKTPLRLVREELARRPSTT